MEIPVRRPPGSLDRLAARPGVAWVFILGLVFVLFFTNLGGPALWDPDEGRHAEIAREAIVTGNWLTPTLAFEPYHDKPMAFYWVLAASFRLFGLHEWAARLPSALAACLTVVAVVLWCRRYVGELEGLLAGVILATAGEFVALGRFVLIDMTFSFWLGAAALFGGAWLLEGARRGWPPWPLWGCLAAAVLVKGPVAVVLVGAAMGGFVVWTRRWAYIRQVRPVAGLLLVAVVAGSWYAAAWVQSPAYLQEFLFRHNVERFVSGKPGHPGNPLFYLYVLPAVFLPWSALWPVAAPRAWRRIASGDLALAYAAFWAAAVFLFFSASRAKLATYMLPAFPPLAVLTAAGLAASLRDPSPPARERRRWRALATVLCAAGIVAPLGAFAVLRYLGEDLLARECLLAAAILGPLMLAGVPWIRRERRGRLLAWLLAVTVVAEVGFYSVVAPGLTSRYSLRDAAARLAAVPRIERVCAWKATAHTLMFYTRRWIHRLDKAGAAAAVLARGDTALLTKERRLAELCGHLRRPVYLWWRGENGKVLLGPFPHPRHRVGSDVCNRRQS